MFYYGTKDGEFGTYDGLQFTRIENLDGRINAIQREEEVVYLLTSRGLYSYQQGKLTQESNNNLNVLSRSADNTFLVTTEGVYHKINTDYFPDKEDFFDINEITHGSYFTIGDRDYFRADNRLFQKDRKWKLVHNHRQSDYSIVPYDKRKMLLVDSASIISMDNQGRIDTLHSVEPSTRNKIYKFKGSEVLLCSDNYIGLFNTRKKELNNIYSLSTELITDAIQDHWGNIWVSAGSYLFQVIDRSSDEINQPPLIEIKSISINGQEKTIEDSYRLDEENNEIEIDYEGVHLTFPQNLEFQSLLSGKYETSIYNNNFPGEWSEPTKEKSIEYRNLKPGKYTYQLRGSVDGKYYMYSDPIVFTVESDLFQSIWLIGILGALGILLSALFFNYRYNAFKEKAKRERNQLIQENKMLSLQQKALQLQMNPHFVFNALNSIQGLIANQENQKARKYLQEFSTMMRSVLNQSREEYIELGDEIRYLKSYLNLEQMANNNKFDWEVVVDEAVETEVRIPSMIIQPFIENAILHGVKPLKERRGKIRLSFEVKGSKIQCIVSDNGIGRLASAQMKSSNHKSVAIDVVNERLRSKLSKSNNNPIQYKDLTNDSNENIGTEVTLFIPVIG